MKAIRWFFGFEDTEKYYRPIQHGGFDWDAYWRDARAGNQRFLWLMAVVWVLVLGVVFLRWWCP